MYEGTKLGVRLDTSESNLKEADLWEIKQEKLIWKEI
jgi:hypothetical protein